METQEEENSYKIRRSPRINQNKMAALLPAPAAPLAPLVTNRHVPDMGTCTRSKRLRSEAEMRDAVARKGKPVPPLNITFKESPWSIPTSDDGVFRSNNYTEFFWPPKRVQNLVKAVNPNAKRETYDKNVRYLAGRLNITPQELLKKSPILIGREFGFTDTDMMKMFDNFIVLSHVYKRI